MTTRRVAVMTADPDLRAAVLSRAALAGIDVEAVPGSSALGATWRAADLVIVGADVASAAAAAAPPRRSGVAVLTSGPGGESLWRAAVELGACRVFVLPEDDEALIEFMAAAGEPDLRLGTTVAVVGGCGGAGASTLAAMAALISARSAPTILIDGDRLGGGIDLLLGVEQAAGARWIDLAETRGRLAGEALAEAVMTVANCAVLSWHRGTPALLDPAALSSVLDAAARAFSCVVIDLPRALDPAGETVLAAADLVVLVVPATVRATAAAAAVAAQLATRNSRLQLVVRDPGAGRLSAAEVAGALGLPVLATIHSEPAVASAADRGELPRRRPRGSLAAACQVLLAGGARERPAA